MRTARKRFSKGWLLFRLQSMPERFTTDDLVKITGISLTTLKRWRYDPYFLANRVADPPNKHGRQWVWNRNKMILWCIAILKLKPSRTAEFNPPDITPAEAREELDMPLNHRVKRNHG